MNEETCNAIKQLAMKLYKEDEDIELDQWYEVSYKFSVTPDGVLVTPIQIFKKKGGEEVG